MVCHGDDFTALGCRGDLDWYENHPASSFELGEQIRMGEAATDAKEARILNEMFRLTEHGLRFEADPRHAEHLQKSLNLSTCKSVGTPGVKQLACDQEEEEDDGEIDNPELAAQQLVNLVDSTLIKTPSVRLKHKKEGEQQVKIVQRVQFDDNTTTIPLQHPYSVVYGRHPRRLCFTGPVGDNRYELASSGANPFTGKSNNIMHARLASRPPIKTNREQRLLEFLRDGANWETATDDLVSTFIGTISKKQKLPKAVRKNMMGAKAVKHHEALESTGFVLDEQQATAFGALAARANYLALDRPDLAFAAKELCRAFARPTASGVVALKRLVRYLQGRKRLVYFYNFDPEPAHVVEEENEELELVVYVDTDFAGCAKTRRSTSGGAMAIGNHLLKHGSTTQPTIALSSGEAELGGIVKGSTHGIGFQSLARDLGVNVRIHVKTDATAAIWDM